MMKKKSKSVSLFKDIKEYHWYPSSRPFQIGIVLTVLWLMFVSFYVSRSIGWDAFLYQPLDIMGNFFEGAFAPLLFLWIVIGFFLQQRDIAENAKNIGIQAQQTQLSTFLSLSKMVFGAVGCY